MSQKLFPKNLFPFFWHFLKEYRFVVILFVFLSIISGFGGPFNSILIKQIINLLPFKEPSILIFPASLLLMNFIIFDNFTWRCVAYIKAKFIPVINNRIIEESLTYCLRQSHQFYQDRLSGKIAKQITNLANGFERFAGSMISNFLRGASLLLTGIITAYFVNPIFFYILIIWFIVFAFVSLKMSRKLVLLSDQKAYAESVLAGELVDSISNHSNVRLFSGGLSETLRRKPFFKQQEEAYKANALYTLIMQSVQTGLIAIMIGVSVYFLIYLHGKNLVTAGDFALILGISMETCYMMWYIMSEVDEFNKIIGQCKQSLMSLMLPFEIEDRSDAPLLFCDQGVIVFDRVNFHYKDSNLLFQNLSLIIKAGEKVGLVGHSGCGKSSFVNLILRLYDITDGSILIDGQDIRNVTQDSLRRHIAMIPQDPSLFQRSLMENIRYGRLEASDEEVITASKKAAAHEFVTKLPLGYDSLVGERGIKLSGGQRQRIAIARALLKNAPILILDEATSQLDSVTENLIQDALWELMKNKTALVIAHRLSTLLHMDRILVFDHGKIAEEGTHQDLLLKNGLYKQLWDAQIGGFLGNKKESL